MSYEKVIYLRVSTEEQDEDTQRIEILNFFKLNEKDCLILRDKVSAYVEKKQEKRLAFISLLDLIKYKNIKSIYVWDLDRLYRNRIKLKDFFSICKENKIKIYSQRQDWLNSIQAIIYPWNEIVMGLIIDVLGWLAEDESKKKSDRVKMKVDKKTGKTKSTYGNKWGRKTNINNTDIDYIKELLKTKLTLKQIQETIQKEKKKHISIGKLSEIKNKK